MPAPFLNRSFSLNKADIRKMICILLREKDKDHEIFFNTLLERLLYFKAKEAWGNMKVSL